MVTWIQLIFGKGRFEALDFCCGSSDVDVDTLDIRKDGDVVYFVYDARISL